MRKNNNPRKTYVFNLSLLEEHLTDEIPPQSLANVLDHVLYEYAILSLRDETQAQDNRLAANSIMTLKRLVDILRDLSVSEYEKMETGEK